MEQPISLYLELEQGQHPDIDVVASATSAFAQLIREVTFLVDPGLEVRIEFESGTEGSLSLNAIVRYVRAKVPDPLARGVILGTILGFVTKETIAAIIGLLVSEAVLAEHKLTDADVARITESVSRLIEGGGAKQQAQEVYRAIEKDASISGVGVTLEKGARPRSLVKREEFRERAGFDAPEVSAQQSISKTLEDVIVLVSPVLELNQRHRKWRFLRHGEPFNATMEDPHFLNDVLTGKTRIPMVAGIELSAVLEITETKDANLWIVTDRKVLDVRDARAPSEPPDLFTQKG